MEGFENFLAEGNIRDELDEVGNGPAHLCAALGTEEMMEKMLQFVNVDQITRIKGETALMVACRRKNAKMVELLLEKGADLEVVNKSNENVLQVCINYGAEFLLPLLLSHNISQKARNDALISAAMRGSLSAVDLMLQSGANLNYKIAVQGWNALIVAASENKVEIIEYLLKKGLDIDSKGFQQETALVIACGNGHHETARYLIDQGCSIDSRKKCGTSALMLAANKGMLDIVKQLVEKGTDLFAVDERKRDALMNAIVMNHSEVVKFLIETAEKTPINAGKSSFEILFKSCCSADNFQSSLDRLTNRKNSYGESPLILAAWIGNMDVIQYLIAKGADTKVKNQDGLSLLSITAKHGHLEVVKFLLEKLNFNIEVVNDSGFSAVMIAAMYGKKDIIQYLIESGADVSRVSTENWTALMLAAGHDHPECAQILLLKITDVKQKNFALTIACKNGHLDCVKLLVEGGAIVHDRVGSNWSPIQLAAQSGDLLTVRYLVNAGANVNDFTESPDKVVFCPLMIAVESEHTDVVEFLLDNGACFKLTDDEGENVLHLACKTTSLKTISLLIERGIEINAQDNLGITPLMICAKTGSVDNVRHLLEHGADPNILDKENSTALYKSLEQYYSVYGRERSDPAALGELHELVKMLVQDYKADVDICTKSGNSAKSLAVKIGDPSILELLK